MKKLDKFYHKSEKLEVIHQSINREKVDILKKEKLITFVGKLNKAKGYDVFAAAIKKILNKKNDTIAYCPERILQGAALIELPKLGQIVSGVNQKSVKLARLFFEKNVTKKITFIRY